MAISQENSYSTSECGGKRPQFTFPRTVFLSPSAVAHGSSGVIQGHKRELAAGLNLASSLKL